MFKRQIFQQLVEKHGFRRELTYQGPYGAALEKGTHLLHNLEMGCLLGMRMTKAVKTAFLEKKANKDAISKKPAKVYIDTQINGNFHGTRDLQSTSIYPQRFCTALHKVWALSRAKGGKCQQ
jgi:hypothetical protein